MYSAIAVSSFLVKETWILTQQRWFFGTVAHHLFGLLAFWVKSLFLAQQVVSQLIDLLCSAWSHHRRSHPWQSSCREDLTGKWGSGLERPSRPAWASTPKPESICLTILWLTNSSDINWVYPRPPFSERNQLRALVNKSPGHNRSVSIQTPRMAF